LTSYLAANQQMGMELRDVWTTAYVNDLPDSAFLYIAPGGTKTDGKTDGAHRYFPVYDSSGKLDLPHLRNALARIPQASSIPAAARVAAMAKAKKLAQGTSVSGSTGEYTGSAGSGRARTAEVLVRSFTLELRAGGDGRTLVGRAVPYGQTIDIDGGRERFVSGAFARHLESPGHVKLHATHGSRESSFAVGKTTSLQDRADGLYGEWEMYNTSGGNDALELVRTKEVTGLSVGFKPIQQRLAPDGAYERTLVHLDHVALTTEPAYPDAKVLAVRSVPAATVTGLRTAQLRQHAVLDRLRV
jgi:HK97 family phage prohead protease